MIQSHLYSENERERRAVSNAPTNETHFGWLRCISSFVSSRRMVLVVECKMQDAQESWKISCWIGHHYHVKFVSRREGCKSKIRNQCISVSRFVATMILEVKWRSQLKLKYKKKKSVSFDRHMNVNRWKSNNYTCIWDALKVKPWIARWIWLITCDRGWLSPRIKCEEEGGDVILVNHVDEKISWLLMR